jgi:hypothetical protein
MEKVKTPVLSAVMVTSRSTCPTPNDWLANRESELLRTALLATALALPIEGTAASTELSAQLLENEELELDPLPPGCRSITSACMPCLRFDCVKSIPLIVKELQSSVEKPEKLVAKAGGASKSKELISAVPRIYLSIRASSVRCRTHPSFKAAISSSL